MPEGLNVVIDGVVSQPLRIQGLNDTQLANDLRATLICDFKAK